ncbi:GNAT family N-acetyltransferase [Pleionea sp. CnH1-48]|uniref:GNAT family N-acetyltransferase n=1 Tax=Pleionea sp. CnH1-48 TaxID=2954494 RepID=UPI00209683F7|nr:GNAT family protein [Pleionea sp. CnH1-48]MCO7226200.1 GNAT family N-acetyltransferase [Pleionea sp. CnH1-48]
MQQPPLTSSSFDPAPITLETSKVRLEPMAMEHLEGFYRAGNYSEIWQWLPKNLCENLQTAKAWIQESLENEQKGEDVPFVLFNQESGQIIGSSRYLNIDRANRVLEIGHTFITPEFQRSFVNTHAKFLLLGHAFEQLGAQRVEFRTHEKNERSRNAIARLGAQFEGILRQNRILPDGSIRSTALFSIVTTEWPQVKTRLQTKMESYS